MMMTHGTHGTFIDHLTRVHLQHQLYGDMWELKPTYFLCSNIN
jgi:hypothetical protein